MGEVVRQNESVAAFFSKTSTILGALATCWICSSSVVMQHIVGVDMPQYLLGNVLANTHDINVFLFVLHQFIRCWKNDEVQKKAGEYWKRDKKLWQFCSTPSTTKQLLNYADQQHWGHCLLLTTALHQLTSLCSPQNYPNNGPLFATAWLVSFANHLRAV